MEADTVCRVCGKLLLPRDPAAMDDGQIVHALCLTRKPPVRLPEDSAARTTGERAESA
ncbi:MAG TPA: hypothetical protein VFX28_14235 [Methylomirabilota bacterium]|nr:hypothetical protein [Methylomirabilota bacterium]